MTDLALGLLAILGVSLVIAGGAVAMVLLRPAARRRRRHRRHSGRPRIELCNPPAAAAEKTSA
ncbi:MAG TPA: hypothetical protein VF759_00730 [Allosphingosinicella sp.]|jgi:hypothetical protein